MRNLSMITVNGDMLTDTVSAALEQFNLLHRNDSSMLYEDIQITYIAYRFYIVLIYSYAPPTNQPNPAVMGKRWIGMPKEEVEE